MAKKLKVESVEEFLKRGGKINKLPYKEPEAPIPFDSLLPQRNYLGSKNRKKKKNGQRSGVR